MFKQKWDPGSWNFGILEVDFLIFDILLEVGDRLGSDINFLVKKWSLAISRTDRTTRVFG